MVRTLDRVLENPRVYALTQALTQMWGMAELHALFAQFVDSGARDVVLELGCGTGRWGVSRFGRFVRTDVNERYFPRDHAAGVEFRRVDATDLAPFPGGTFDLVYSFGLYHHLADADVSRSLRESARVLRSTGRIVVFDAIWPTSRLNVAGWLLRKLDRGDWIRTEQGLQSLARASGLAVARRAVCGWGPGLEGCFLELRPTASPAPA